MEGKNRRKEKIARKGKIKERRFQNKLTEHRNIESKKSNLKAEALILNVAELENYLPETKYKILDNMKKQIVGDPYSNHKLLLEAMKITSDNDFKLVCYALQIISEIFVDILPAYRIRLPGKNEEKSQISKEQKTIREYEISLLKYYQSFLHIIEFLSKLKTKKILKEYQQDNGNNREKLVISQNVLQIKRKCIQCLSIFLDKLMHFNFRQNITISLIPKLYNQDYKIKQIARESLEQVLKSDNEELSDIKLLIIKEFSKLLKSVKHSKFDENILDILLLPRITKVGVEIEGDPKIEEMKQEIKLLKKKRKMKEVRELQKTLVSELKESQMNNLDSHKIQELNKKILESIMSIYFDILRNRSNSCLLKSVLTHLPLKAGFLNIEMIWDLLEVLKGYIKDGLACGRLAGGERLDGVSAGIHCALGILNSSYGKGFDTDERVFVNALYTLIGLVMTSPATNFLIKNLLLSLHIVFITKKQFSQELISAFVKRVCLLTLHLPGIYVPPLLLFVKIVGERYSHVGGMLEQGEDTGDIGGYNHEVNDPVLAEAKSSTILTELGVVYGRWVGRERDSVRLFPEVSGYVKGIIQSIINKGIFTQVVNVTPDGLLQVLLRTQMQILGKGV